MNVRACDLGVGGIDCGVRAHARGPVQLVDVGAVFVESNASNLARPVGENENISAHRPPPGSSGRIRTVHYRDDDQPPAVRGAIISWALDNGLMRGKVPGQQLNELKLIHHEINCRGKVLVV